jgi:hypothetical protein
MYLRNGEFVEYCRVHDPANRRALTAARNAFEGFTLDHVRDERGQKITVNSIKELREAEKKYDFVLDCATNDNGDTSKPPAHEPWAGQIDHDYVRKFNRDPEAYKRPEARKGVSAGVVDSADKTLVYHPRPL